MRMCMRYAKSTLQDELIHGDLPQIGQIHGI